MILGTSKFKEKLLDSLDEETIKASVTDYNSTRILPSPTDIDRTISQYFHIDEQSLYLGHRGQENEFRV